MVLKYMIGSLLKAIVVKKEEIRRPYIEQLRSVLPDIV
jgi:hypothetical protein